MLSRNSIANTDIFFTVDGTEVQPIPIMDIELSDQTTIKDVFNMSRDEEYWIKTIFNDENDLYAVISNEIPLLSFKEIAVVLHKIREINTKFDAFSKSRIYSFRRKSIFQFLWYDPMRDCKRMIISELVRIRTIRSYIKLQFIEKYFPFLYIYILERCTYSEAKYLLQQASLYNTNGCLEPENPFLRAQQTNIIRHMKSYASYIRTILQKEAEYKNKIHVRTESTEN